VCIGAGGIGATWGCAGDDGAARGDGGDAEAARGCTREGGTGGATQGDSGGVEAAHVCVGDGVTSGASRGGVVDRPAGKGGMTVGDIESGSRNTSSLVREAAEEKEKGEI
jgi:hypothetical protein